MTATETASVHTRPLGGIWSWPDEVRPATPAGNEAFAIGRRRSD